MQQIELYNLFETNMINIFEWTIVILIYCSITVNHRLTGPGKMVKVRLLFVGIYNQTTQLISQLLQTTATTDT